MTDVFPDELHFSDYLSSIEQLGSIGAEVPSRAGPERRTDDHRDWWLFRRWFYSLCGNDQIQFPFSLKRNPSHIGGPDFIYSMGEFGPFGLEMTEATYEVDQREMTEFAKSEVKVASQGEFGGRSYESGSDDELKAEMSQLILAAAQRKLGKSEGYFERCLHLELMIYVNANIGMFVKLAGLVDVLPELLHREVEQSGQLHRFGRISVMSGSEYLCCFDGRHRMIALNDGLL